MAYIEERQLPVEAGKKEKTVYRARIRIKGKPIPVLYSVSRS